MNLFGDLWQDGARPTSTRRSASPGTRLYLYGKRARAPGRKMGHLSAIGDTPEDALDRVQTRRFPPLNFARRRGTSFASLEEP